MKRTGNLLKIIKTVVEIVLLAGLIAVPAILVHMGADVTVKMLSVIWLVLGIPLGILLALDIRQMRREEETAREQETREYLEWLRNGGER